ncbi:MULTISPECIES: MlaD family protein [unclassified Thermosynechococcus]|uniref:MlaD family protein n=1 Tax=unclassified Thermosynechococcus TaxID=2622553 RepID=UPI0019DD48EA|nr:MULTISPECIES: MlaD family protein [unclassified Thermosynechococcus]HIK36347.1 MCE family protein [Thermosynechococcus sp. M98_K2018_005]HIK48313.1 MCE family protein [Thermosynechococcus sp. M55_K2018_012]
MMQSRRVQESLVGLVILAGLATLGVSLLWLRGNLAGANSYTLEVELDTAPGLAVGTQVRYRGVQVGRVTAIGFDANGVLVGVRINNVLIPRSAVPEIRQSGFIGQAFLDFTPKERVPQIPEGVTAFAPKCQPDLIYCNGDRVTGVRTASLEDLVRAAARFTTALEESGIINNANTLILGAIRTVNRADQSLTKVTTALDSFNALSNEARAELRNFGTASQAVTRAANQISELVEVNRNTINSALRNIDSAARDLRTTLKALRPLTTQLEQGELLANLDALIKNGAEAAANLNKVSGTLSSPIIMLSIAQTLDAARATFINAQKLTNDLLKLTGDESFQSDLRRLIKVLSRLLASSEELEQQFLALHATSLGETQPPSPNPAPSPSVAATPPKEEEAAVTSAP